jgi:hypothetical protein
MDTTAPRLAWWSLFVVAAVGAALVTAALVLVSAALTPPCPGPWCLYVLLYLPISGLGSAGAAVVIAAYARRGVGGYVLALLAGAAGYGAAWWWLINAGWFYSLD